MMMMMIIVLATRGRIIQSTRTCKFEQQNEIQPNNVINQRFQHHYGTQKHTCYYSQAIKYKIHIHVLRTIAST